MSTPAAPGSRFLRALAAAALRDGDPAELAERAADALGGVFQRQKSLVLDVQFTGFQLKGKPLGGVDPELLRAAGQLIVRGVTRVGFTPDAHAGDLRLFFDGLARQPADLGERGIAGWMERKQPHGIYLSTSTAVYRPPARPAAAAPSVDTPALQSSTVEAPSAPTPEAAPAPPRIVEAAAPPPAPTAGEELPPIDAPSISGERGGGEAVFAAGGFMLFDDADSTDLSDFELIEEFPELPSVGGGRAAGATGGAGPAKESAGAGGGTGDMFHFFRAVGTGRDDEVEKLPALLHAADNVTRFDELAEAAARAALRLVRAGEESQAAEVLDALVREAERPDRTRLFRESAVQAIRRVGSGEALHAISVALDTPGANRDRVLRFLVFAGGEAHALLESLLFRTVDGELRMAIFRSLSRIEGMNARLAARALSETPGRARMMLEAVAQPGVEPDVALAWLTPAATHADPGVRGDVARHAASQGGRGGLRILLDLLNNDRDAHVRRAAAEGLGVLGDAAATPFLTRLAADAQDEELQVAAIQALGAIGSSEAISTLLGIATKRGMLFTGRRITRPKTAAIQAIARIPSPAAREALTSLAAGKDADVAAEAQRALSLQE